MWQVVLDTNIIRENWLLDGPSVAVLKKFIHSNRCRLFIPDVVRREVKKLFREEVSDLIKAVGKLNRLITIAQVDVQIPAAAQICQTYDRRLDERLK
jgi:rRNA-processing protein FCF1